MKLASLLLIAFAVISIQGTAHAQNLSGAAGSVRSALLDLLVQVDKKMDREAGRDRVKDSIQRTRAQLERVQALADSGAPRDAIVDAKERAREGTFNVLGAVRGSRNELIQRSAAGVRERLEWLDGAWAGYRGGYQRGGYGRGGYDRGDDRRGGTIYVPVPARR